MLRVQRGRTGLIWATYQGHLDVVKYLVENGADIEAKEEQVSSKEVQRNRSVLSSIF